MFLEHAVKRARRYAIPFTLGFVGIDSFSFYNHRHTALQGDCMLQKIADLIRVNVRQADLIARYAGDIFAVILEAADTHTALTSLERVRYSIEQSNEIPLTVSIGLASFPRDASNKGDLIYKAEEALKGAKIRGRNRIYGFEREESSPDHERSRVLIVDDHPRNIKLLEAFLRPLDLEILTATSGVECLQVLESVDVDLLLLDVMMPGMNGFEVCRRVKTQEATRTIPIVLVTALDDMDAKIQGIEAGADDFLTKPPNKMELRARTRSLLRIKQLNKNLTSIEHVLFSLANSVEAKDAYTQGHTERVSQVAVLLGKKMGLSSRENEALRFAGVLHDIGKLGVPGDILNKPGSLDSGEWDLMKRHSEISYKICLPLKHVLGLALDVIRHHHEKLDGSGYPDGLKGTEVSLGARIMAVADIYDALTTNRPYRKGLSRDKAIAILRQEAYEGKLDQDVVEHLIEMIIPRNL
jgi:putative two-component system response regulator